MQINNWWVKRFSISPFSLPDPDVNATWGKRIIAFQAYIDRVLEPSKSLARLLRNAQLEVRFDHESDIELKANFIDVAQISGALNSLARSRLLAFAEKLHERTGGVVAGVPESSNKLVVDYEISNVHLAPFATMIPPEKAQKQ